MLIGRRVVIQHKYLQIGKTKMLRTWKNDARVLNNINSSPINTASSLLGQKRSL